MNLNISIGTSLNVDEAKILLSKTRMLIDEWAGGVIPDSISYINWGNKKRGQGKRSGGTIVGSMSAAPYGIKKYIGTDCSKYKSDWDGNIIKLLGYDGSRIARYFKAREFGCNQIEARLYAIS